jgi:hypothetical protein
LLWMMGDASRQAAALGAAAVYELPAKLAGLGADGLLGYRRRSFSL